MKEQLREKCAVVGVSLDTNTAEAAHIAYQALFALQHRGVEGSGIATITPDRLLEDVRGLGMVRDVFRVQELRKLTGGVATGHNRYSTSGSKIGHTQPVTSPEIAYALSHNGNFPITDELELYLEKRGYKSHQYNDSGLFGKAISSKLHGGRNIAEAVREIAQLQTGAYSCTGVYDDMMFAFRDPHGIRPLDLGSFEGGIVAASETCALDTIGASHLRPIAPGELVIAQHGNIVHSEQFADVDPKLDIFELVYFSRHDSYLYGERVNEVRRRFGYELAQMHPSKSGAYNSIVVPIPDTSVPAAEGYAEALGISHTQAVIKNRYVGRTFMQPDQESRRSTLRLKHTMISERVAGKDVHFIDDSIVRGNTMPNLVRTAKAMGAKSVSVLIASPPVRFPDFYGVDTPSQRELLAANLTVAEMRRWIDCDYLGFLSISAMVRATRNHAEQFNLAAFNGEYPIEIGRHADDICAPKSTEYME